MAKNMRYWVSMIVLGLVILFVVQNIAVVEVNFFIWTVTVPRAILLLIIFVAGAAFGWFGSKIRQR